MELINLTLKDRKKQYRVTKLKLVQLAERGLKQAVCDRLVGKLTRGTAEDEVWKAMKSIVASEIGILHGVEPWPAEPGDKPVR